MTFTKTILESEEAAQTLVKDAHQKAQQEVEKAERAQKNEYAELEKTLLEERNKELLDQKASLVSLYKETLTTGKSHADTIANTAQRNQSKAVDLVLKNIANT